MTLQEMTRATKKIAQKFNKPWTVEARTLDLVEEVGELCNAILAEEGYKHPKRKKSDITDSLCDVLFDLLLISDYYEVDLDNQYFAMLKNLQERQENKEFSD